MGNSQLSGVLAVFQTPFTSDDHVDFGTLEAEIDWLFSEGTDGIVFAMVSEILRLSLDEREEVASHACKFAGSRGPVVIGVGAESTALATRLARHAQGCGAAAVMPTPPMLTELSDDQLRSYFNDIAAAIEIPVVVQDASGYVGKPLSIELQAALHHDLGDRVLFKPEAPPVGPKLTALMSATGGEARVFEGTGGLYLVDSFRRGAIGTMPAGDLIWALVPLWAALQEGDFDRAYTIAAPLALLISLQTDLDSFVAVEKFLLVEQGIFPTERMRGPNSDVLDSMMRVEVLRLVERLRDAVDA